MTRKRGAALPTVLLVAALTSALMVAGLYAVRSLGGASRMATARDALQYSAEQALLELVCSWDSLARASQPIGAEESYAGLLVGEASVAAWVTRLNDRTYWLVAEAGAGSRPRIRTRIGLLVRADSQSAGPVPGGAWVQLP